jgi:hypothetical protein
MPLEYINETLKLSTGLFNFLGAVGFLFWIVFLIGDVLRSRLRSKIIHDKHMENMKKEHELHLKMLEEDRKRMDGREPWL